MDSDHVHENLRPRAAFEVDLVEVPVEEAVEANSCLSPALPLAVAPVVAK